MAEVIVSFINNELRIDKLRVRNFRKFESYFVKFDQQLTVLVGDNGTGKSTLIDGACVALGALFQGIEHAKAPSLSPDDARGAVIQQGDALAVQPQYPVSIDAAGVALGESLSWTRSLNSPKGRTTRVDAAAIIEAGKRIQDRADKDINAVLPVLARYGTDRLWRQGGSQESPVPSRTRGYEDALEASSNESRMNAWFRSQSIWEWQNKKESSLFTAVRRALASCFDAAASTHDAMVDYDAELKQLVFTFSASDGVYHRDRIGSMSDGYRGTLSLIADIAYRMASLNPAMGERMLETPGVILIDEVDLHLHPRWQARILEDLVRIFPNVQFIVTTHSPIVVASVPKHNIRVLGAESAEAPAVQTRGRDASDILKTVLDAASRPEEAARLFDDFNSAVDGGDYARARNVLNRIEDYVGPDDPDAVAARTTLELEELLS